MNKTHLDDATPDVDQIDKLQAGLFYLMTQYTFSQSPAVAAEIVEQVNTLLRHPLIELLPAQRAMLAGVLNRWRMHRSGFPRASDTGTF